MMVSSSPGPAAADMEAKQKADDQQLEKEVRQRVSVSHTSSVVSCMSFVSLRYGSIFDVF
jgi:hypothetical protein